MSNPELSTQVFEIIHSSNQAGKRIDMRELSSGREVAAPLRGVSVTELREALSDLEARQLIAFVGGEIGYTVLQTIAADSTEEPIENSETV